MVFRLRYKNFSFLFTGDLNDEAGRELARRDQVGTIKLQSDVFKVPHHMSKHLRTSTARRDACTGRLERRS